MYEVPILIAGIAIGFAFGLCVGLEFNKNNIDVRHKGE